MELNLQKLLRGAEAPMQGTVKFDFSARDFSHFSVPEPAIFSYNARFEAGAVVLDIRLQAGIEASCARCLAPICRPWTVEKTFRITRADMDEDFPELPFTPAGGLDLSELAYGELLLEVDPVLLCSEDCAGLCPTCGLPDGDCRCEGAAQAEQTASPAGDPRLQVLRQLLSDDETTDE